VPVPVKDHSDKPSSRRLGDVAVAMFDFADLRAVDLVIAVAKRGGVQIEGELSIKDTLGELRGEGVSGMRPPAVFVEKTRPFMGVQTATDAIEDCSKAELFCKTFFGYEMQTKVCKCEQMCEVEEEKAGGAEGFGFIRL